MTDQAARFLLSVSDLKTSPGRKRRQQIIHYALALAALTSIVISVLIVWSLLSEAWVFIVGVEWTQIFNIGWFPRRGFYDVRTILVPTLIVTIIAMIIATPLGLGAAIYLSEYARPRTRAFIKPILEILAGIPSVVLGFFALNWVAPEIIARISGNSAGSMAAAGVGVGVLTIPLVASISEDAMAAVPSSLREASVGLGSRKINTTIRVVIPAAISGIVASLIVGISRAIGETMVVFIAGGAAQTASFTTSAYEGGLTMTAAMASLAVGTDNVVGEGLTVQSLYFVGLLLFLITLGLNLVANRFVSRIQNKY